MLQCPAAALPFLHFLMYSDVNQRADFRYEDIKKRKNIKKHKTVVKFWYLR